jgi:Iron/zinc purple acid phosphatase-like protein C
MIILGHDHAYMRTHPVAYDKVDVTGYAPIYLTLGAGGNREGHSRGYRNPFVKESWVAFRTLDDFGYGHLFVPNATHARFQWIRDRTSSNTFEDIAWLSNPHAVTDVN